MNILFSGDLAPIIQKNQVLDNFFAIQEVINNCDFHVTDLECPITISEKPICKSGPHLKAEPFAIELLKLAKVTHVCLANNHILDYDDEGLQETIEILRNNSISHTGIFRCSEGYSEPIVLEKNGIKIAIINYCENEFSVRDFGKYSANGYDPIKSFYEICNAKKSVDFVIVVYHGGNEYYELPSPELKKSFHYFVDLGADAVICHHAHVFSGFEFYKSKPIIYGLGNFFFPYPGEPKEWHYGLICILNFDDEIKLELLPISQCYNTVNVERLNFEEESLMNIKIHVLSDIIRDDPALKEKWDDFVNERSHQLVKNILNLKKYEKLLLKIGLRKKNIFSKSKLMEHYNVVKCESHRRLLIDSLKKYFVH